MTSYIWLKYSSSDYGLHFIFYTLTKIQQPNALLQKKSRYDQGCCLVDHAGRSVFT